MKPAALLVLYHSGKETKTASELTLENAMRGSGELGAAVSTCWATRLQDPDPAVSWTTPSYLTNVKQRDFESKPFEATSGPDYRMHIVGVPGANVVLSGKSAGTQPNADGNEGAAEQVIRDNPALSLRALEAKLKELGIKRRKTWIGNKRFEIHKTGVKVA